MPRLNSQFPPEYHKDYCENHEVIRLSARAYNNKGKRTSVPRALECLGCGVVVSLSKQNNLTKKQLMSTPPLPKIISENEPLEIKSKQDTQHIKKIVVRSIRTTDVQSVPTPTEEHCRAQVRELNKIYKKDEKDFPRLKGRTGWDPRLVERFLDVRPDFDQMYKLINWPPLYRYSVERANYMRGYVPDPNDFGNNKYDHHSYNLRRPSYKFRDINGTIITPIDLDDFGEWEKLIMQVAKKQMEFMEDVIRESLGSKIQIHYPVDDDEKQKVKNKTE